MGCMLVVLLIWSFIPDHGSVAGLKWLQFLQSIGLFIVPACLIARLSSPTPAVWLHLDTKPHAATGALAMLVMIVAVPTIGLLSYLNQQLSLPECMAGLEQWMIEMESRSTALMESFLQVSTLGGLLCNLVLMALLAGLGEELTFRATMQNLIQEGHLRSASTAAPHVAIWVTAIIFSLIHLQFYGFVPRMLMGAMFGYVLYWTGSLWIPIIMHATNNAVVVVVYYVSSKYGMDSSVIDTIGSGPTLWLGLLSMVLTGVLIWLLRDYSLRRSRTISNASSLTSEGN